MTIGKKPARAKRNRARRGVGRPFRAGLICVSVGLLWISPATARGGGHGFGFHAGGRMSRGGHMLAPASVLITVLAVSDADAFKKAIEDMTTAVVATFTGRIA